VFFTDADRQGLAAALAEIDAESAGRRLVPPHVERYRRESGISSIDKVRWCDRCGVVAPAIDHHQISLLDAVGFDTWCPDCKCPPGP